MAHTGRAATSGGFRKRVLYLDAEVLDADLIGAAVAAPSLDDALLRTRVDQLHRALDRPGSGLEAESRLALIGDRIRWHLRAEPGGSEPDGAEPGRSRPGGAGWRRTCGSCWTTG